MQNALRDAGQKRPRYSTRIPRCRKMVGKEPNRNINPDECVALRFRAAFSAANQNGCWTLRTVSGH